MENYKQMIKAQSNSEKSDVEEDTDSQESSGEQSSSDVDQQTIVSTSNRFSKSKASPRGGDMRSPRRKTKQYMSQKTAENLDVSMKKTNISTSNTACNNTRKVREGYTKLATPKTSQLDQSQAKNSNLRDSAAGSNSNFVEDEDLFYTENQRHGSTH